MYIGILVPLPQELASLTKTKISAGTCIELTENVAVCLTGVGPKQTELGFEQLLNYPIDMVISWGSAAGLSPKIAAGDLLIPEAVKVGQRTIITDAQFNEKLISYLPTGTPLHRKPVTESRGILATSTDKKKLYEATGCVAADMESGAVAQLADLNKIPFSVVRSVSDPADMALPKAILDSFRNGTFRISSFLGSAVRDPVEWPQITKLMGNFNKVKKTLIIASDIIKKYSSSWT